MRPVEQSRLTSLIEVSLSTAIGFVVSVSIWPLVAAAHGYPYSVASSLSVTAIYTAVSVLRGYVVRRFFARGLHNTALRLARRGADAYR